VSDGTAVEAGGADVPVRGPVRLHCPDRGPRDEQAADLVGGFCVAGCQLLAEHQTQEIKTIGDALMLRTGDAAAAIRLGSSSGPSRPRHRTDMATRARPHRPWVQGPLAAPEPLCCQHSLVAAVLPGRRLGRRGDPSGADRRRRRLLPLERRRLPSHGLGQRSQLSDGERFVDDNQQIHVAAAREVVPEGQGAVRDHPDDGLPERPRTGARKRLRELQRLLGWRGGGDRGSG
jgi:hypothetical protein